MGASYECTLPSGEVTRFSSMVRYYYLLDRETYRAVRCPVEPVHCNACQKIVEAESCVTEDDFARQIENFRSIHDGEAWVAELECLKEFLTLRTSGKKCLACGSENLVAIQANLDMMLSGIRYYAFLDKEGNGVPVESSTIQKYLYGGRKIVPST